MQVQPYAFVDPDPATADDLTDVVPVKPLPANLLDPTRWDVPWASHLIDLGEEHSERVAFELWASDLLALHDTARQCAVVALVGEIDDELADAVAAARNDWNPRTERGTIDLWPLRRELMQPFATSSLTFRQIAAATLLPLSEIVAAMTNPSTARNAERYADLEEAIIGGALAARSVQSILDEFHTDYKVVYDLAARHGIDPKVERLKRGSARTIRERELRNARARGENVAA